MCHAGGVDDVTWFAFALTLTLVLGLGSYVAYRRRGLAAGLTGAGLTLLPMAAYLTRTLRMFTRIGDAVADWAVSLVFSPTVWLGMVLAAIAVALVGAGRVLRRRTGPSPLPKGSERAGQLPPTAAGGGAAPADPELAEIEALLRRRGIS